MAQNLFSILSIAAVLLYTQGSAACATDVHQPKNKASWKKYWLAHNGVKSTQGRKPSENAPLPSAKQDPWGGSDTKKWQPEAVLANAVSEALNDGWADPEAKDVLVALPAKMQISSLRPYGDGQTNAALNFGSAWSFPQPPMIATLLSKKNGDIKFKLRLHRSYDLNNHGLQMTYNLAGQKKIKHWQKMTRTPEGDFEVEWQVGSAEAPEWGDLFKNNVAFVQPDGWQDWFPLDFRNVVKPASELLAQVPVVKQKLGHGSLLDPENVSVQGKNDGSFPFLNMQSETFGKEINADRYFPVGGSGIHNEFPENGTRITAVGHGNTLVMIKPPSPFKLAYICFDARNPHEEAKFGVPSGGGWHEIGDPAETVFNTLEEAPVVFGYANGQPAATTPSGSFAQGLADIIVVRKLMPGSALITAAGTTTAAEEASGWQNRGNQKITSGRNYHWFVFNQAHEICATEWVHPHIPSPTNHLGMDPL